MTSTLRTATFDADWHKSHWRDNETDSEHAERVSAAEVSANWYFAKATKPAHQHWRDTLTVIEPYRGSPRWTRLRDAAQEKYRAATSEAHALYEFTAEEIMRTGEVSEETGAKWDAMMKLDAARSVMEAAE